MNNTKKSIIGQSVSIVQWIILIGLGIIITQWWGWLFALGMFIIHSVEAIVYGIPKGKTFNYTPLESLCLTWFYGFTWWKFLDKSIDK